MWIDYVRVENRPAHQLFKGQWDSDIIAETDFALTGYNSSNPIPNNFYMEEFEFNTVPAIKYVNNLIMNRSNNKLSLMVNLNAGLFRTHRPRDGSGNQNEMTAQEIKKFLIDSAKIKYLVNGAYQLEGGKGMNGQHCCTIIVIIRLRLHIIRIHYAILIILKT